VLIYGFVADRSYLLYQSETGSTSLNGVKSEAEASAACCSATEKNWHKEIRLAGNYPPTAKLLLLSALAKIQFDLCCTHTESHVKKKSSVAPFAPTKTWKIIYYVLPKGTQCSC
jgi:hypothetical protein